MVGKGSVRKVSNNRPGQATNWPAGGLRWSVDLPVTVKVVTPDEPAIETVSDPSLDPSAGLKFAAKAIRSDRPGKGSRVELDLVDSGQPHVTISANWVVRIGTRGPGGSMIIAPARRPSAG